ncbi:tRNA(Met) cytidine acetyltransferase TmcA [Photobacterium lipolyticum]|uniref:tRNA(Met) cytidine acetyltransferase TmcA n=1 Tax=Photobacterium lipolyticum TaxID=266810 RepID=A0A2T3MWV5_9GAMM|nr:GNAT family N-acetyltransferase [Photobacterium lipolyticum]PSW04422.1 P-loop ATPase [Photobacterium lipolyticum]
MSELYQFASRLAAQAKEANCRYLVVLDGDLNWATKASQIFLSHYHRTFWAGDNAPDHIASLPLKKAKKLLGQETDCLVYNAHLGFDADAFGALSGTVTGGGLLLLMVPHAWFDQAQAQLPFIQRLAHLFAQPDVLHLRQCLFFADDQLNCSLPLLPMPGIADADYFDETFGCLTLEQKNAVEAIRRVVTGHRKRPLVLTADRGRGKSSALGIAAASLMRERNIKIAVTSPAFANANTLFAQAARSLNIPFHQQKNLKYQNSELMFIAPDALLSMDEGVDKPEIDFLVVDEAAAIPAPLLKQMLTRYNRITFATTIHGYEGTGRGFAIKFRQQLERHAPQWRQYSLSLPIRWSRHDPLEKWVFKALLLEADPADVTAAIGSCQVRYRVLSTESLIGDERRLNQLFGLLVNAHYQTTPSDISQLLDDPAMHLVVAEIVEPISSTYPDLCSGQHSQTEDDLAASNIVGCCLLSLEGGFDEQFAEQIMLGKRRPKGHLLAQSIAAHIGLVQGASQRCARILRIAVHPDCLQRGIGTALLAHVRQWADDQSLDYLGTSFGVVGDLLSFWQQAGYSPVRLGILKDAASGAHSLLAVLPLSVDSLSWFDTAVALFAANFLVQRVEQFRMLEADIFVPLYQYSLSHSASYRRAVASCDNDPFGDVVLSPMVRLQLMSYIRGGLGYDLAVASLEVWLAEFLRQPSFELNSVTEMAVAKVLQKQSWELIVQRFGYASRRSAEQALRDLVAQSYQC